MLRSSALFLLKILSTFIPKNKNQICFKSFPDYSGNALKIYEYIKEKDNYNLVWLVDNNININFPSIKAKSLSGLWVLLRSKIIVTTHNEYVSIATKKQKYISLWHGMPLKKIGFLAKKEHTYMKSISASRISTSELTRSLISASFHEKANNVYITGQPVCDTLFSKTDLHQYFTIPPDVKKILFYLPTYRQDINELTIEGRKTTEDNIFKIDDYNHEELLHILEEEKLYLIIKLHPSEEKLIKNIKENSYLKLIRSDYMPHIDTYSILSSTDCLLTDYSSVYIDYLILNRDIAFVIPDYDEYYQNENRGGFTLEPYDEWTPGPKIKTQNELITYLKNIEETQDSFKKEREKVAKILHKHIDGNSSRRVYENLIKN
ncbi:CDP-glycerol glycerophosphotransferase family protein [Morganella morganii]|uniref:CDP-glycerol glycerophosphotransferase family protein n=1 Tax=Morganella morganii TaxID=582 RepID=UPI001BD97D43|nr:CDP-glycerol glycerophosphotransferase family protein [Morganella morganii]MBT0386017.1 CDP-glycerol glycerophosphotransferase family protein [Morganella morganii subsp. morganii]